MSEDAEPDILADLVAQIAADVQRVHDTLPSVMNPWTLMRPQQRELVKKADLAIIAAVDRANAEALAGERTIESAREIWSAAYRIRLVTKNAGCVTGPLPAPVSRPYRGDPYVDRSRVYARDDADVRDCPNCGPKRCDC